MAVNPAQRIGRSSWTSLSALGRLTALAAPIVGAEKGEDGLVADTHLLSAINLADFVKDRSINWPEALDYLARNAHAYTHALRTNCWRARTIVERAKQGRIIYGPHGSRDPGPPGLQSLKGGSPDVTHQPKLHNCV
jgi:hypothetical protein